MTGILHMSFCKTHGEEKFLTESLVVHSEGTRKSLVSGFKEVGYHLGHGVAFSEML